PAQPRGRPGEASPAIWLALGVIRGTREVPQVGSGGSPVMSEDASFRNLVRRLRAGEPQVLAELERLYGPSIRAQQIRIRLKPTLRSSLGASVCITVSGTFLIPVPGVVVRCSPLSPEYRGE